MGSSCWVLGMVLAVCAEQVVEQMMPEDMIEEGCDLGS